MNMFGSQASSSMASHLGIDEAAASTIVPQVIPLVLGGLKRQMETQGGPARVDHILNKYGSEDVLGRIGEEMASRAGNPTTDARLGGLLGDAGIQATDMISQKFGLSGATAGKIIPMLAPLILGALSRQKNAQGGAGLRGVTSLLDRDGDGSILDDVAGMLFQGGGSQGGGGLLGNILGGLLGKKG
jgi:hypothetical protein